MRVVVAPDKFKGSLSAAEAAEAIARGLKAAGADPDVCPMADGGEGTLDALVASLGGTVMGVIARGPLGIPVRAHIGRLADGTGVVELSQASGLRLVAPEERDPMRASTYGTGELIKGALARRPHRLIVGLGGSATVDGGVGLARALGVRFLDADGHEVPPQGGGVLSRIASIDASRLDERFASIDVLVAADVLSPLLGPEGAAHVYGPQKGASSVQVELLEQGLASLARVIERDLRTSIAEVPGAGAAGGAGGMLLALGAALQRGADVVAEAQGLAERIAAADLVVTGEGRLDASTTAGKAPAAVAELAKAAGVPCVALVGEYGEAVDGFDEVRALLDHFAGDRDQAMARAAPGLQALAARLGSDRRRR
ncbi:MAG TPA: glycerate kinase [Actinomycetota bacterium]